MTENEEKGEVDSNETTPDPTQTSDRRSHSDGEADPVEEGAPAPEGEADEAPEGEAAEAPATEDRRGHSEEPVAEGAPVPEGEAAEAPEGEPAPAPEGEEAADEHPEATGDFTPSDELKELAATYATELAEETMSHYDRHYTAFLAGYSASDADSAEA